MVVKMYQLTGPLYRLLLQLAGNPIANMVISRLYRVGNYTVWAKNFENFKLFCLNSKYILTFFVKSQQPRNANITIFVVAT